MESERLLLVNVHSISLVKRVDDPFGNFNVVAQANQKNQ